MKQLKFKAIESKVEKLIFDTQNELIAIQFQDARVADILKKFKKQLTELKSKIKLEIAFVGQYNAGKSTIMKTLTGNDEIIIGQDVTTEKVEAYSWGNVILVDTPGIYAGRPDHDEISIKYMDKADLLVYVITTQGFSEGTAENFRQLAFSEDRINKMMLVINKSSQGNQEIAKENWIEDALKVTDPKTANDVYLSIIDAQDYLEAQSILDKSDKNELINYSGFDNFIANLNQFISDKGMLGRLITPLNVINTNLNHVINLFTAINEDVKNLQELIQRKQFRLKESKLKIETIVDEQIHTLCSFIKKEGQKIANLIEKGSNKEILDSEFTTSKEKIEYEIKDTSKKIEVSIESEFNALQIELDILMDSELAHTLINKKNININFNTNIEFKEFDKTKFDNGLNIVNQIGTLTKGFTTSENAVNLGLQGLKKVSGSDAHKAVYNVGKFFGKNFEPWGAVKIADKFAKVGNVLSHAAVILPVLAAGYEQHQEKKDNDKIIKARQEARKSFDDVALEIKSSFQGQFQKLLEESYHIELKSVSDIMLSLRDDEKLKDNNVKIIENILKECNEILVEIND